MSSVCVVVVGGRGWESGLPAACCLSLLLGPKFTDNYSAINMDLPLLVKASVSALPLKEDTAVRSPGVKTQVGQVVGFSF